MKENHQYIRFIRECIEDVDTFISSNEESFILDKKTQYAVIRALQILAESTQRLSPELKEKYPEVDWRGIAGFRNVLVHDYFGINPVRIWEIVKEDLPILKRTIEFMLETESQ